MVKAEVFAVKVATPPMSEEQIAFMGPKTTQTTFKGADPDD
jgi:hypothetical protein